MSNIAQMPLFRSKNKVMDTLLIAWWLYITAYAYVLPTYSVSGIVLKSTLFLADVLISTAVACCAIALLYCAVRTFVADQFVIPAWSMAPTLVPGDRVGGVNSPITLDAGIPAVFTYRNPLNCIKMQI